MSRSVNLKLNVLSSWVGHAVTLVVGFFLMPYVLGVVGKPAYGSWVLINAIACYAGLLYLGFGQTLSRFVATYSAPNDRPRLNGIVNVVLATYCCMASLVLLLTAGVVLSVPWWHRGTDVPAADLQLVAALLGINVAVAMVGSVFGGVLHGCQRFDQERSLAIGTALLRAALTVAFLQRESGLVTLALVFLAVTLVEVLLSVILAFRNVPELRFGWRYVTGSAWRECWSFSLMTLITSLAWHLMQASDAIVVGFWFGPAAVVPYYIASRLCQFVAKPIQQVGVVCMPRAGELSSRGDLTGLQQLTTRSVGLAFLLSAAVWVGTACFGDALISAWMGGGFPESHGLLLILLAAQVIAQPGYMLRSILIGMGYVRGPGVILLTEALLGIALSLVLVRPYGMWGVAVGTILPMVVIDLGWLCPFAMSRLKLSARQLLAESLLPQLLPLTCVSAYAVALHKALPELLSWPQLAGVAVGAAAVLAGGVLLQTRRGEIAFGSACMEHNQTVKS